MKVGAQLIPAGVDRAAVLTIRAGRDDQQRPLVEGEPERPTTRQTYRILERQMLPTVRTGEITHGAVPFDHGHIYHDMDCVSRRVGVEGCHQ